MLNFNKIKVLFLTLLVVVLLSSCSTFEGGGISNSSLIEIETINVNNDLVYIKLGDNFTLQSSFSPQDATTSLVFTSTDSNVASVNKNGVIEAKSIGEADIKVSTTNRNYEPETKVCHVIVVESFTYYVNIKEDSCSVYINDNYTLDYEVNESGNIEDVYFYSEDESIATVSDEGIITGISTGSTYIRAITKEGYNDYVKVTVSKKSQPSTPSTPTFDKYKYALAVEQIRNNAKAGNYSSARNGYVNPFMTDNVHNIIAGYYYSYSYPSDRLVIIMLYESGNIKQCEVQVCLPAVFMDSYTVFFFVESIYGSQYGWTGTIDSNFNQYSVIEFTSSTTSYDLAHKEEICSGLIVLLLAALNQNTSISPSTLGFKYF